jgi:uncharacterized protein involved in outer membrane biogenesis
MKKTATLLLIALALAGTLAWLWFSPEQVLKRAVEQEGSAMTGGAVRVEKVSYAKQSGIFVLTGVAVANPPGFPAGDVVVAPVVEIAVDPASLDQAVVRIERLTVSAPRIRIENGPGGSNFEALEKALKERPAAPGARRFLVATLSIQDARSQTGGGAEAELLGLRSEDLGASRGGVTAVELARHMAEDVGRRVRLASGIESIRSGIRSLLGE